MSHAKADESDLLMDDCFRPLTPAGERAAASMADQLAVKLAELEMSVDVLISSHAVCSRSTAEVISSKFSIEGQIDRRLYDGGVQDLHDAVHSLDYRHNVVIMVGRNPTLSEFFRYITNTSHDDIPFASAVVVELAVNTWRQIFLGKGLFVGQLFPAVEVVEEVQNEPPPQPRGWKERLCHWLDLKTDDDDDEDDDSAQRP